MKHFEGGIAGQELEAKHSELNAVICKPCFLQHDSDESE